MVAIVDSGRPAPITAQATADAFDRAWLPGTEGGGTADVLLGDCVPTGKLSHSWGHAKGHEIFAVARAVSDSADVLVCKLVDGRVSFVHRRLWPSLVKLADRFRKQQPAKVWNQHTSTGAHRLRTIALPDWVPAEIVRESERLATADAERILAPSLGLGWRIAPARARR